MVAGSLPRRMGGFLAVIFDTPLCALTGSG
jgi:hypothetical protein